MDRVFAAMGEALEIVLGDDHLVFLDSLTLILTQLGHQVLAALSTTAALMASVRAFHPDVCVVERSLHGEDCLEVIPQLSAVSPNTRVVVLTADVDPGSMRRALDAGAAGYVHKTRNIAALLDVLGRVHGGEIVVEGSFARPPAHREQPPKELLDLAKFLTQRELECLALLAGGLDTSMMARRLGVSTTTVRSHVQAVLTKLGVHSRLEAASLANRYHLVDRASTLVPSERRVAAIGE